MDILVIKNALLLLAQEQYPDELVKDVKFFTEEECYGIETKHTIIRYSVQTTPSPEDDFIFYCWHPYRIIDMEFLTKYARDARISILLD